MRAPVLLLALAGCTAGSASESGRERIVSAGGAVTEIVYALGAGPSVVAADTSSTYPAEAGDLPRIGYQRALSAEGVLSLRPTVLVASAEAGPATVLDQLRAAGVKVAIFPSESSPAGAAAKIRAVGAAIGRAPAAERLAAALETDVAAARRRAAALPGKPRVLFLYSRGGGTLHVGGRGTPADVMLGLAGAANAVTDFEGYRPFSAEGFVAAAPDVILVPAHGLEAAGGMKALLDTPGIRQTPAGAAARVVAMDDSLLLGFGPRLAQAIDELARLVRSP